MVTAELRVSFCMARLYAHELVREAANDGGEDDVSIEFCGPNSPWRGDGVRCGEHVRVARDAGDDDPGFRECPRSATPVVARRGARYGDGRRPRPDALRRICPRR